MYRARSGDRLIDPVSYFVISQMEATTFAPLTCSHMGCNEPVHFYGREAAGRKVLGIRLPNDVEPHFDHYDGTGANCPNKAKNRTYLAAQEILSRPASPQPPEIAIDTRLMVYSLAVLAQMYGQCNMSLQKFDDAKKHASEKGYLRLEPRDAWRVPYALGLATTFESFDGKKLGLVTRDAADLTRTKRRRADEDDLFVVYAKSLVPYTGRPLKLTREHTDAYARQREGKRTNLVWAREQLNPQFSFAD